MRVLITGYGPFFNQSTNPSLELINQLSQRDTPFELVTKELPVEFEKISEELLAMDLATFDTVLFFGLAASRKVITVEKLAVNIQYCPARPDNSGLSFDKATSIKVDGPLVLQSSFDCEGFNGFLNDSGLKSELSFHAGTYVCNATLYHGLDQVGDENKCAFIHLPIDVETKKLVDVLIDYFS